MKVLSVELIINAHIFEPSGRFSSKFPMRAVAFCPGIGVRNCRNVVGGLLLQVGQATGIK